jgi:hypothetical protein
MIRNVFYYYYKINYFGQKACGWKNAKTGLNNFVTVNMLFVSSGIVIFLASYFRFSFFIWLLYAFFYYKIISPLIEKKIEKTVNYDSLDYAYNKINWLQKIKFTLISISFFILSLAIMIAVIFGLSKLFK